MALDATTLGAAIKTAILSHTGFGFTDNPAMAALCDAIASAVVTHIVAAAVVTVPATGLAAPPGGGPVTGAAVGSIS